MQLIWRVFDFSLKSQFILLFSLFLLLFMSLIALFDTIHGYHCTISTNFYLYLEYFQQKASSFSKISDSKQNLTSSIWPKLHQSDLFAPYSTWFFPFHEKLIGRSFPLLSYGLFLSIKMRYHFPKKPMTLNLLTTLAWQLTKKSVTNF